MCASHLREFGCLRTTQLVWRGNAMIWEFLGLYVWLIFNFTENVRQPRSVEMTVREGGREGGRERERAREREREKTRMIFPCASKSTFPSYKSSTCQREWILSSTRREFLGPKRAVWFNLHCTSYFPILYFLVSLFILITAIVIRIMWYFHMYYTILRIF